jgi:hypothetical protein
MAVADGNCATLGRSRTPRRALSQITPGDLDVAVFGQLPAAELALSDPLETGSLEIVGFDAAHGGRTLR